jgi:hypothetical protein
MNGVTNMTRVLLVADDPRLLEAGMLVLGHFWSVTTALVAWRENALARAVAGVDVVVLYEGVEESRRRYWVEAIRENSPEKILVQMDEMDAGPGGGLDASVATSNGPGALVATIYGLLVERGLPSKGWRGLEATLLEGVGGGRVQ